MLLPLGASAIVAVVLLWELSLPRLRELAPSLATTLASYRVRRRAPQPSYDPGRELRAEQRARMLLRSCVNDEEWAMYRDLGFLRVWGERPAGEDASASYAYLIYPHRPIVAYVPQTGVLLNEYCVAFPDHSRPYGSVRLPDADDVLAKWMALAADERRLIADANMHLPGRQLDPEQVRDDLARLDRWQRERAGRRSHERMAPQAHELVAQDERTEPQASERVAQDERMGRQATERAAQPRERPGQRERGRLGHPGRGAGSVPAQ
jgi:hypothetical protein